jgi:hypothetical protein
MSEEINYQTTEFDGDESRKAYLTSENIGNARENFLATTA